MQGARVAASQAPAQQFQRAHDNGQHIVEVVGDAAGQLADGLHLLRLAQLVFQAVLLGDIDADTGATHRPAVLALGIAARQHPAH